MNRKERRAAQKKLGLTDHYKTLSRSKKFHLMSENIEYGKKLHDELREEVRIYEQQVKDNLESISISNLAQTISKSKKIPIMDAQIEAEQQYKNKNHE